MDMKLSTIENEEGVTLFFDPLEDHDTIFLLQLVWEEAQQKGMDVPACLDPSFFKRLFSSGEEQSVKFDYEHAEFLVYFLEELISEREDSKGETSVLKDLLKAVEDWLFGDEIH